MTVDEVGGRAVPDLAVVAPGAGRADEVQVEVDGLTLALAEAGRGGRPLLLVHGFTGAKEDFGDWYDVLAADGWWVVAPDLRGHGGSGRPEAEAHYSLARFAADLLAIADHLGWDRFALLGHSMGGMVAQEVALRWPARIDRLVLMDTHHAAPEGLSVEVVEVGVELLRNEGLPALLALLEAFPSEKAPADARVRATRAGYEAWNRSKLDLVSPAMYAAMALELVNRPDRLPELATLTMPTRVIVGEQDRTFLAASVALADAIPTADLVVVPDAAHSPQFENPDAWYRALTEFLLPPG